MNQLFSKRDKALLRELAGQVWEAELNAELERLYGCFCEWKEGTMNPFDLSNKIHQFHKGAARSLYNLHNNIDPWMAVARGLELGLLPKSDVDAALLEKLLPFKRFLQTHDDNDDESA